MSEALPQTLSELLTHISYQRLGIRVEKDETPNSWESRAIYSIVGLMATSALWNHNDLLPTDEQDHEVIEGPGGTIGVSKVYWKRYAKKLFYAYRSKFPNIAKLYPDDLEKLISSEYIQPITPVIEHEDEVDIQPALDKASWEDLLNEMLDLYIQTGSYYNKNYYIGPSVLRHVYLGQDEHFPATPYIYFVRGFTPNTAVCMSGLGAWVHTQEPISEIKPAPLEEVFNLQQGNFLSYYNELHERFTEENFVQEALPSNSKFLRLTPRHQDRWGEYWVDQPQNDGDISLARYGNPGQEVYYLYRRIGDRYKLMNLASFETNPEFMRPYRGSRAYIKIASALLARRNNLPPIQVVLKRDLAEIQLGYLLPPEEQSFFKLYSWPSTGFASVGENFNRKMHKCVYRQYKRHLEQLGYTIVESEDL